MTSLLDRFLIWAYSWVDTAIYVWGANGQEMTPAKIKSMETSTTNENRALALYNKRVKAGITPIIGFDCSGLISRFLQNNGIVTSKRNCNHLAKTYCERIYSRGSGGDMEPGDLVFWKNDTKPYYHVAIYAGGDTLIESRGRDYGVVTSSASKRDWDCWGRMKIFAQIIDDGIVLQRGDKGAEVRRLQEILMAKGYTLPRYGADGDFGAETEAAVMAFQAANELPATGIVNDDTWAALEETPEQEPGMAYEAVCTGGSVNVRSGPGTNHTKLGVAHKGDTMTVTAQENSWCEIVITIGGRPVSGYMSAKYIKAA